MTLLVVCDYCVYITAVGMSLLWVYSIFVRQLSGYGVRWKDQNLHRTKSCAAILDVH